MLCKEFHPSPFTPLLLRKHVSYYVYTGQNISFNKICMYINCTWQIHNTQTHMFQTYFCIQSKWRHKDSRWIDRLKKKDKDGSTQVCFDVEGISVVYSKAFQKLLRLSISFLPLSCVFLRNLSSFLESYAAARHQSSTLVSHRQLEQRERTRTEMNAGQRLQQQGSRLKFMTGINSKLKFNLPCWGSLNSSTRGAPRLCSEHLVVCHPQRLCGCAYTWLVHVICTCGLRALTHKAVPSNQLQS